LKTTWRKQEFFNTDDEFEHKMRLKQVARNKEKDEKK